MEILIHLTKRLNKTNTAVTIHQPVQFNNRGCTDHTIVNNRRNIFHSDTSIKDSENHKYKKISPCGKHGQLLLQARYIFSSSFKNHGVGSHFTAPTENGKGDRL